MLLLILNFILQFVFADKKTSRTWGILSVRRLPRIYRASCCLLISSTVELDVLESNCGYIYTYINNSASRQNVTIGKAKFVKRKKIHTVGD